MQVTDSEREAPLIAGAWQIVALLWPVAMLNYLDRQMMAAMKTSLMHDIPMNAFANMGTEAHWGLLPAAFKWVYAALSPIGGYVADRYSRRHVIAISLFVWSAVTWLTGHVETFSQLLVTRALMGISEACYFPAALALIADYHLGPTRSRAVGIHQMAIYVGMILGGFSGYAADHPQLGWRLAFSVCGVVGVLYAVPLFWALRTAAAPSRGESPRNPSSSIGTVIVELISNTNFLLLVTCFTLPAMAGWIVKDWMAPILKDKFAIGQGMSGVSATLFTSLASFAGVVWGGWLADRWSRRTARGRIFVNALGISLLVPALFGVSYASTLLLAILFLILFGIGWGFFDCNNMPILCQIVRPELRATGYGLMNLVSISCGGFADVAFGRLRDHHVPLATIFSLFALGPVISIVCMLLIRVTPGSTVADRSQPR